MRLIDLTQYMIEETKKPIFPHVVFFSEQDCNTIGIATMIEWCRETFEPQNYDKTWFISPSMFASLEYEDAVQFLLTWG